MSASGRQTTIQVDVGNVSIGANNPVVVQSMTNTDTADIQTTAEQVLELYKSGSQIVRITVNNNEAAQAVPYIKEMLEKQGYNVPLVGCFHYNGHQLLADFPECAKALDKYRINPGNVGFGNKRDKQFEMIIETAIKYDKPVRIGVNWGSLDQTLLTELMDRNAGSSTPISANDVLRNALVQSTILSAQHAEKCGLSENKIILSAKTSKVQDLVAVYRAMSKASRYPLHLGLTEAGMGTKGLVATTAALAILLQEGIGNTIRASLTPAPGEARTKEVELCQQILQSLELQSFTPQISACPGCGRTTSTYFQQLASDIQEFISESISTWKKKYPGVEELNIAVMGCIVNGPGESKHADIGISLPGTGESPVAPVFIDGQKSITLRGDNISSEFKQIIEAYIVKRFQI